VWGKIRARWPAALLGCLLLVGCAGSKAYYSKNFVTLQRIAVLPMANETTDLDGPPFVRQLIFKTLAARGYSLVPLKEIDDKLLAQGFTDGGQLGAATPQQLGQWIGADAVFYSTLEYFDYISVGFYSQRRVKLKGKIADTKTGERLWEAEREGITRVVVTNKKDAETQFAVQLAVKAAEKMTHTPLKLESEIAVGQLITTLSRR
jgi:hypothetical protein